MGTRLATPRLTAVMDDGAELSVQVLNVDMLKWDRTATKHRWPAAKEAPFVWMTFLAWHALTREQQIPAMTLDQFETRCLSVTSDQGDDGVDPTNPDPAAG